MVSIIIPVYNVRDYILRCLESVASQTYNKPMECLIIDDCGSDDSILLAEDFVLRYSGTIVFRIIHHEKNKGLSAARNTGINNSKGKWLYFLDSDDWIIPECMELMMEQAKQYSNVDVVFAGAISNVKGYEWLNYEIKDIPSFMNCRNKLQYLMLKRYDLGMTAWNKLISKSFLCNNSLFFEEGFIHEDEIWNFRVSNYINSACFVKRNTYNYVCRPNSIITNEDKSKYWNNYIILWEKMTSYITDYNKNVQIKAICNFIIEITRNGFPTNIRLDLFFLYKTLSIKSISILTPFLLRQGVFALLSRRKYVNQHVSAKIILK